jgi:hypothetical protein
MSHPWVTDEGRVPLHSCADMGLGLIEVTAQEQLGAIDRASVVSMIRARLKEKSFRSKEYLFQVVSFVNLEFELVPELILRSLLRVCASKSSIDLLHGCSLC